MEIAFSIIFGGLITIATAIGVEYFRRPKLSLAIEDPPCDVLNLPADRSAHNARHVRLFLRNEQSPHWLRWMQRAAALQCRGEITFHHLNDGQDMFSRSMAVRRAGSPQPIASQIVNLATGTVQSIIIDYARTNESRMDVYPGEEEILDVASRFDDEQDCFGWNNESYAYNWRTPHWRLGRERYLVKVVITSSGQKCVGAFRLINDVDSRNDFRLTPATTEDKIKLGLQ